MEQPPSPVTPLRLVNVHFHCGHNVERVQANIDRTIFDYFFNHVMAGDRGCRQALISTFFQKFYEQCIADGISATWDPSNDQRLADILSRLNFRSVESGPTVRPKRPISTGRAGVATSKSKAQSSPADNDGRGASRIRAKAPDTRHQPASPDSGA